MGATPRKPDLRFKFLNRLTEEKGEIGAGWLNEDGSVSIVLNPKVVLTQNKNELLNLFPIKNKGEQPSS